MIERLKELMKDRYTKCQQDYCRKYEKLFYISRASAANRFQGKTNFSISEVEAICNHYNVSADWLLFGIGEKRRSNNGEKV